MSATEIIVSIFLLLGTVVMLLSAIGLVRFGDVFLRMHAATKTSTLGVGFLMVGVAIFFAEPLITVKLVALLIIFVFTAPIGAQVLAQGAHLARVRMVKETWVDDLAKSYDTDSSQSAGNKGSTEHDVAAE